jgi:hypothetical protein
MSQVGFEPMVLVLEHAKTVHALDSVATVTGPISDIIHYLGRIFNS